jgi:hypothetical protein
VKHADLQVELTLTKTQGESFTQDEILQRVLDMEMKYNASGEFRMHVTGIKTLDTN